MPLIIKVIGTKVSHCDSKVNFVHGVIGGVTFFYFQWEGPEGVIEGPSSILVLIGYQGQSWWQSVYMLINTCEQHRIDLFHLWVNFDIFKI